MSFRQVYVKKEIWPKVILKRLSVSLTHPFKCTRCKQRFHKIHEANAHYLNTHQISNDLLDKEIPANETKIEIEKFDSQMKNEMQTGIKEEVKFETEVQRGLKILEKLDVLKEISQEPDENQEAKSPHEKVRENEDMQLENKEARGNEKFTEFDLLQIEEADIDFSEGEIDTDYLVHFTCLKSKNITF